MAADADITIYATQSCPYCHAARDLLRRHRIRFAEIVVGVDSVRRRDMTERSGGGRTVPQIFLGDRLLGGLGDLYALEGSGELNRLLSPAAAA